jgi:hypothetical protein
MLYQYLGVIIGISGIIITFLRFRDGKMSLGMLSFWSVIWVLLIIFSILPDLTSIIAKVTGIGRGLDLILILGLITSYYLVFKMYNRMENMEEEITQLVREIALQNAKTEEKEKKTDE